MQIISDLAATNLDCETVLTIGAFDGMHRGHRQVIRNVVNRAREQERLSGLVTFYPHPRAVLRANQPTRYLTTPGEKVALAEKLNLDLMAILAFDRHLAASSAREFITLLLRHLHLAELWVGRDFALGRNREGDVDHLQRLSRELGFTLQIVEPVVWQGQLVSSTRIRRLLEEGEVAQAAQLLGRYFSLAGEVVSGARRGHQIGFPTANLEVRAERATPADGIYATYAWVGERRYQAVTNIGVRPTFDNGERIVETHLLDFEGDLYGQDLVVEFVERLRGEQRFPGVEALVAQIRRDVAEARKVLTGIRFRELDHTADLALEVYGRDMAELFANAAYAVFSLMTELPTGEPTVYQDISLEAPDYEALLVDWLNELIYLHEVEGETYTRFTIEDLSSTGLKATVRGNPTLKKTKAIKAATFHDLRIEKTPEGFAATIVFDV